MSAPRGDADLVRAHDLERKCCWMAALCDLAGDLDEKDGYLLDVVVLMDSRATRWLGRRE